MPNALYLNTQEMSIVKSFFTANLPPTSHLLAKISALRLGKISNRPTTLVVSRAELIQISEILKNKSSLPFDDNLRKKFLSAFIRQQAIDLGKIEAAQKQIDKVAKQLEDFRNLKLPVNYLEEKMRILKSQQEKTNALMKQWG